MAELISTGSTTTSISPFDIRRFTQPSLVPQLATSLFSTGKLI
jgi:sarcosine oxidase subunit beta